MTRIAAVVAALALVLGGCAAIPTSGPVTEVEDDGTGEDPERVRQALAGDASMDSVGLGNVDARLRNAYGDDYGLVVETAPGAGTKVIVRVPKFAPGVQV